MSEKLIAFLLRLYPSGFRAAYGEEALQLIRERVRHERGIVARMRLWFDLVADLGMMIFRGFEDANAGLASAGANADGVPSFQILPDDSPRRGAVFFGGIITLVTLMALPSSFRRYTNDPAGSPPFPGPTSSTLARQAIDFGKDPPAPTFAAMEHRIVEAAIANVKEHYVDRSAAEAVAETLETHERKGDYSQVTDGQALADRLTKDMKEVSHDAELVVVYSEQALPDHPVAPSEAIKRYRAAMMAQNCTFENVEILPHSVGYVKLNSFPDVSVCEAAATTVMQSLNHAQAVIFDLRDNRGGFPEMVALISSYLFDHPEYLYNPRENTTARSWTRSPVPGNRLADKPVLLLTSARTASGAEQFCYDLKMLKRATLVGETTRGAAHAGVFHRLDEHFGIGIPETRPINPFSDHDWEGVGVEPDVKVDAAVALETATGLAEKGLTKK
jgi:hypothetical protein